MGFYIRIVIMTVSRGNDWLAHGTRNYPVDLVCVQNNLLVFDFATIELSAIPVRVPGGFSKYTAFSIRSDQRLSVPNTFFMEANPICVLFQFIRG